MIEEPPQQGQKPELNPTTDNYLMKSLININFCGIVIIDNSTFVENWMYEPSESEDRAMIIYL